MPEFPDWMDESGDEEFVDVVGFLDRNGSINQLAAGDSSNPRLEELATASVKQWKFKPAMVGDEPASVYFKTRILFKEGSVIPGPSDYAMEFDTPPKVIKAIRPRYPEGLQVAGNKGLVNVVFILNTRGEVLAPRVRSTTHPGFEREALATIVNWRYSPALQNGKPVPAPVAQPISFSMDEETSDGVEPFEVKVISNKELPKGKPPSSAPEPKVTVFPVYPYDLAVADTRGNAKVKILINAAGEVVGSLVESASQPEFGAALAAALEAWQFIPAIRDGKPVGIAISREQKFARGERDVGLDAKAAEIATQIRKGRFKPAKASELDRPPRLTFRVLPVFPTMLRESKAEGSAKIEIIVDKRGRAVLPRILEASEPEFGWAAATAVQRWQFEPPTVGGKPVEVKVVIPVKFTPPEPPSEATDG